MHRLTLTILASLIPTFLAAQEIVINRSDFVVSWFKHPGDPPLTRAIACLRRRTNHRHSVRAQGNRGMGLEGGVLLSKNELG